MGNPNIFEARLNQVKTILDDIGFGELYGDLEIFEELLRTSDPDVFIKK